MNNRIKVGFCVAYDWYFLKHSLPLVYKRADEIHLFVDIQRKGWSGASFEFDEDDFLATVNEMDVDGKISVHQESFYVVGNTPPQNEVMQRNRMAEVMQYGGWHIQLDCDEYFLNFEGFVDYLYGQPMKNRSKTNICCPMVTLYKEVDNGYLYVKNGKRHHEYFSIATSEPRYEYGRRNGYFNICTDFCIIHQSWARSEEDISNKLKSWGHVNDINPDGYFNFWRRVNENNYKSIRSFHPIQPECWESLVFVEGNNVGEFIMNFDFEEIHISKKLLFLRNSRLISKWNKLMRMLKLK